MDQEFIFDLISKTPDGKGFEFATFELRNNMEFVLKCLKLNGYIIKLTPPTIRTKELFKKAVFQGGNHIEYVVGFAMGYVPEFGSDREFVLKGLDCCGSLLEHVCEEFKNDKEIVYRATLNDDRAFKFASDELKNDREFVLKCVKHQAYVLFHASIKLASDREFVLECVKLNGRALEASTQKLAEELKLHTLTTQGFLSPSHYSNAHRESRIEHEYPELLGLPLYRK